VEALDEQNESEDGCHAKARRKEPTRLTQGVQQEDAHEHGDRTGECQSVIRTNADQTSDFELTQHEADQTEGTVEGNEGPQTAELAPAGEVALGFRAPQEQQGVTQAVGGSGNGNGEEVAAFEVRGGESVGVPGGDEGGAGEPAAECHVGTGEQQQTRPADEDESVALEPVIEDVEPSSLCLCASHCYGHFITS
jgi:hypothetical protein